MADDSTLRLTVADQMLVHALDYLANTVVWDPAELAMVLDVLRREAMGRTNPVHPYIGRMVRLTEEALVAAPDVTDPRQLTEWSALRLRIALDLNRFHLWRLGQAQATLAAARDTQVVDTQGVAA